MAKVLERYFDKGGEYVAIMHDKARKEGNQYFGLFRGNSDSLEVAISDYGRRNGTKVVESYHGINGRAKGMVDAALDRANRGESVEWGVLFSA